MRIGRQSGRHLPIADLNSEACNIVQLLLRLSNDVEENPGPTVNDTVDCSHTTHASFNQGNELFGSNAGKQCVAMSLSAIVYKEIKSVNVWN